jgi:hypothetical protein
MAAKFERRAPSIKAPPFISRFQNSEGMRTCKDWDAF